MSNYVSFDVAKRYSSIILNVESFKYYSPKGKLETYPCLISNEVFSSNGYVAFTLQQILDWLEEHRIIVTSEYLFGIDEWRCHVRHLKSLYNFNTTEPYKDRWTAFEQALILLADAFDWTQIELGLPFKSCTHLSTRKVLDVLLLTKDNIDAVSTQFNLQQHYCGVQLPTGALVVIGDYLYKDASGILRLCPREMFDRQFVVNDSED